MASSEPKTPPRPAARTRRARPAAVANLRRQESSAARLHKALRAEIVGMQRLPGEAIAEKDIAAVHGVSRTPVREALLALAGEGLVDIFPQIGTFVARIPLNGMPEAMLVREALEGTMVRLAAEAASDADIAGLTRQLAEQAEAARAADLARFYALDEDFHATIARIAGYPGVWSLVQQVKYQIDRFRLLTLGISGRPLSIVSDHLAIIEAIAARQPERAAAAMAAHLATVRTGLATARAAHPEYFA
jgi:DNA-binding GntR family transcriptional regulator